MRLRTTSIAGITAVVIAMLAAAAPALAGRDQVSIIQADRETFQQGPGASASAFNEFSALGVDIVKAQVMWRDVAPAGRPADPSSPAAYDWSRFDMFVRNARRRGLRPYLSLGGRAPDWASKSTCRGARPGTCRPSNTLFRQFALAAGRHYTGGELHVDMWSLWNEPNLAFWLNPQRSRRGVPLAPSIYRRLYAAGRKGLSQSGHGGDRILLGELAPLGSRQRGIGAKLAPLTFIREMACVKRNFRPLSRRQRRARRCSRAKLRTNGFAIHPYTARLTPSRGNKGPRARARPDDATLRYLGRLRRTLDKVRKRLGTRKLGIWITEFGFQSKPPDEFSSSLATVARYLDESEYIAYTSARVKSIDQYTLFDDPVGTTPSVFRNFEGFQLGLRFATSGPFVPAFGGRKPKVYDAYRMPVFAKIKKRNARGRVEVFAGVRAKRLASSFVTIDTALPGQPFRRLRTVRLNRRGYFRKSFRLSRATRRTFRVTSTETGQVRLKRAVRR